MIPSLLSDQDSGDCEERTDSCCDQSNQIPVGGGRGVFRQLVDLGIEVTFDSASARNTPVAVKIAPTAMSQFIGFRPRL